MKRLILFVFFLSLLTELAWALIPDRRPYEGESDFGWMLAPTPIKIEGIGSAVPLNAILSNFHESADAMIFRTLPGGDFQIDLISVFHFPLLSEYLLVSAGAMTMEIPVTQFNRGIDSDRDDFIQPFVEQHGNFFQAKFNLWEERFELFYQTSAWSSMVTHLYDKDGNRTDYENPEENSNIYKSYAMVWDLTDSKHDPRKGIRFGQKRNLAPAQSNPDMSTFEQRNSDVTFYIPMDTKDTLVFNLFESRAILREKGIVDEKSLREISPIQCDDNDATCKAEQDRWVSSTQERNLYGDAEGLGGPNRLRAYPMNRFHAGNSRSYGLEYRWNFSEEAKEFNWWLLGGMKTNFQLAAFYEQGTVNDNYSELSSNLKSSYGVGFRAFISGLIYRLDIAWGDEGVGTSMFIDYPMELNPIAN